MKRYAKSLFALILLAPVLAAADSPVGVWRVENGQAHIRIVRCGAAMWGVISWLVGEDQSSLGTPIVRGMMPDGDDWKGEIYNSENGKIYSGSIHLTSPDVLRIRGCVLGFLCGGEDWMRISSASKKDEALCRTLK